MAFFDVQNLFRHAKDAFQVAGESGYHHPNFDPLKLHRKVAAQCALTPNLTRFYTGVPPASESPMWSGYWANRVRSLKRSGVLVETRKLRYHRDVLADGSIRMTPQEKGIDIRIALDLVACARRSEFDAAIIFSQDQDLAEAVKEVKEIVRDQGRAVKLISAFPASAEASSARGIDQTVWFRFDRPFYDACIDAYDYRPIEYQPSPQS